MLGGPKKGSGSSPRITFPPPPPHAPPLPSSEPGPGEGRERWCPSVGTWGREDTNDLHTAALPRRPAAGGPRRWGSGLQESQGSRSQRGPPEPNQPLPLRTQGDDTGLHCSPQPLWHLPPPCLGAGDSGLGWGGMGDSYRRL